jgi:hypothetical protein
LSFSAAYLGSSAVGNVRIEIDACVTPTPPNSPFGGIFTITTNVGTLNGTVSGELSAVVPPPPQSPYLTGALTLTVLSGTGRFTGTTGTLNVSLQIVAIAPDWAGTITPA